MNLASIRVLWRDRNGGLWGIPYGMRPGQSPHNLWDSTTLVRLNTNGMDLGHRTPAPGPRPGWIWLGGAGWYGSMTADQIQAVQAFLAPLGRDVERLSFPCYLDVPEAGS